MAAARRRSERVTLTMSAELVASDPPVNSSQRFPLIAVVPITGTQGLGSLYPALAPGASLSKPCYALVDQLRSIAGSADPLDMLINPATDEPSVPLFRLWCSD